MYIAGCQSWATGPAGIECMGPGRGRSRAGRGLGLLGTGPGGVADVGRRLGGQVGSKWMATIRAGATEQRHQQPTTSLQTAVDPLPTTWGSYEVLSRLAHKPSRCLQRWARSSLACINLHLDFELNATTATHFSKPPAVQSGEGLACNLFTRPQTTPT